MKRWLLDTGPIVAYLDKSDSFHTAVANRLDPFVGELHTTDAVVVESMHFLAGAKNGPQLLTEYLISSGTRIHPYAIAGKLVEAVSLMTRYANLPMDFADATLVLLGESLRINRILTLDRRGFSAYRMQSKRGFELVLFEGE